MNGTRDCAREHCGLFGLFGVDDAADLIHRGLFSLQHRGQEGAGVVVSDGECVKACRGLGLVNEVFSSDALAGLRGGMGIGHVRYSTTGAPKIQNVQPLVVECADGIWAVAHNGNLVNAARLRAAYQESGAIFQTSTDSETLIHLLADPQYRRNPNRVGRALAELQGAFAFLLMTKDRVMAARDPAGFRPLSVGTLGGGWAFGSETCALKQVGAEFLRDIEPGELVTVDSAGLRRERFSDRPKRLAQCIFELVYFARPDSSVFGENVHRVRVQYGMRLAEEHPVDADIVVAVPDSGNSAALGFARAASIPFDYGFIRNHYVGRTFIMPGEIERARGVDMKLAVLPDVVRDMRVVVVDDSIVRGTTMRKRIRCLREAGAREVHVRVSCPQIRFPCYYGIDFATAEELIAGDRSLEGVRNHIEADSLGHLSVEGLLSPLKSPCDYCVACFTGGYQLNPEGIQAKYEWEKTAPQLDLGLQT